MRKRKMVRALLMLVCIFVLSACKKNVGTPEDNAVSDESSETEELAEDNDTYVFGFSGIDMENPYFITLESAIREVIEKEGYELITKDPASNPKDQEAQIEEMIREGIDGIFLCPVDWEAITPVLDTLKEANVRIINVDTQVKEMDYVDACTALYEYVCIHSRVPDPKFYQRPYYRLRGGDCRCSQRL